MTRREQAAAGDPASTSPAWLARPDDGLPVDRALGRLRAAIEAHFERADVDDPLRKWRDLEAEHRERLVEDAVDQVIHTGTRAHELDFPGIATLLAEAVAHPEKLSAGRGGASGRKQSEAVHEPGHVTGTSGLRFRTAREIATEVPAAIDWLWAHFIAFAAVHELVGRAKAAGKTTFVLAVIGAVLGGEPFLGLRTTRTPVVLLTEQPPASFRAALGRAGLDERDDLIVLYRHDAQGSPWIRVVEAAIAECRDRSARLLVVDTLSQFAGIRGDAENDAGAALAALEPLQAAAATGLAVVVVRHERKGGGEVGDSGRGSSAFTGAVDVVMKLGRLDNPPRPTIRKIETLSRFAETPDELVIELTPAGYVALGDESAVALVEARTAMLDLLPDEGGLTLPVLLERSGIRRTTAQAALSSLITGGVVVRVGSGRKGDPHRFARTPLNGFEMLPNSIPHAPAQTTNPGAFVSAAPMGRGRRQKANGGVPRPPTVSDSLAEIFAAADEPPEDLDVDDGDQVELVSPFGGSLLARGAALPNGSPA